MSAQVAASDYVTGNEDLLLAGAVTWVLLLLDAWRLGQPLRLARRLLGLGLGGLGIGSGGALAAGGSAIRHGWFLVVGMLRVAARSRRWSARGGGAGPV